VHAKIRQGGRPYSVTDGSALRVVSVQQLIEVKLSFTERSYPTDGKAQFPYQIVKILHPSVETKSAPRWYTMRDEKHTAVLLSDSVAVRDNRIDVPMAQRQQLDLEVGNA
jgi:hypothetical protein